MKKFFLASAILSVVLFSCKKEKETEEVTANNSPTAPLTIKGKMKAGKWRMVKELDYVDGQGYSWEELAECSLDDYLTFVGDSAFYDDLGIVCPSNHTDNMFWTQSENSLDFSMDNDSFTIIKLDSDSLVFYETNNNDTSFYYHKNMK
ncbi:MAG: lipocalin family protein [Cytophagaceae bacterium]|jgi:hypothetical protein|nr:lipocalin family protein [Cytophagaceae bacterium]